MDSFATPFVQGRLRNEELSVKLETSCAHTNEKFSLTIDSNVDWQLSEPGPEPIIFSPNVDLANLKAPNIINDF